MIAIEVLKLLPECAWRACVLQMPRLWIENNFDELPIKIEDIFHQRTWSLAFIEHALRPEHTDLWDHISTWYTLSPAFCERNIDWLNFYELVYSQNLPRAFYSRHAAKIDWLANPVDRARIFEQIYK